MSRIVRNARRAARWTLEVTHISGTVGTRKFFDGDAAWTMGLGLLSDPEGAGIALKDHGRLVKFAVAEKALGRISDDLKAKGTAIPEGMVWEAGV